ncbi:MAG: hypothetical protein GVY36_18745 [Verrucomicrobia bacterium]|jgi:hypothetical protein|nr:hypothetical protein [Verrucomicrobiota bacterium]
MILGYLLFAIVAGVLSSLVVLMCGGSLLLALCIYPLVGTLTLIMLALTAMLFGTSSCRDDGMAITSRQTGTGSTDLGVPSVDRM